jgi:hypothetical protein
LLNEPNVLSNKKLCVELCAFPAYFIHIFQGMLKNSVKKNYTYVF